ncbi:MULTISPECIES: hypothetical protein [Psychrilyobacter]|uniref:Uncharacterized protein n=1 Tax=Psychrilyobacter piezotolerans TaxID=2293438 RepID=A0ABX9KIM9_9FUSO|nr:MULTISPECIES: hypothetical protein [Psychrilyobacter]MCS5420782.1 hypothetical protein [Psychrilyobacter sp. S5]NDI77424.1 hypothetical protein [Psychrilyobacter piezotolerans]RDE63727.1 hypothetical protein DV867_04955 [Psychrilyobacter sp. S5]REI42071.1 hypothetical protein DYH56_04955 [Psychrilyobacter piezotolerans]
MAKIRFDSRKPSKPYKYKGVQLQFYILIEGMTEYKTITKKDGTTEQVAVAWWYEQHNLPWRIEFEQGAEYDEYGEVIKQDYITEHFDELLAEAKQI